MVRLLHYPVLQKSQTRMNFLTCFIERARRPHIRGNPFRRRRERWREGIEVGKWRLVGEWKFHSWGKSFVILTNIHSDWMSNPFSDLWLHNVIASQAWETWQIHLLWCNFSPLLSPSFISLSLSHLVWWDERLTGAAETVSSFVCLLHKR